MSAANWISGAVRGKRQARVDRKLRRRESNAETMIEEADRLHPEWMARARAEVAAEAAASRRSPESAGDHWHRVEQNDCGFCGHDWPCVCPRCGEAWIRHPHTTDGVYSDAPTDCPGWAERCPVVECRNPARPGEECAAHQAARCLLGDRPHWPHGGQEGDVEWSCPGRCSRCGAPAASAEHLEWCGCDASQTSTGVDVVPADRAATPTAHSGSASHGHFYGWSERHGAETFEHEHERGDEPHEHVLRDGGTEVKRTTWGPTRAADVPGQS